MSIKGHVCAAVCTHLLWLSVTGAVNAAAATIEVPDGGNLQAALDGAAHGDTILLAPGATYIGNFIIRRGVTVRTDGPLPEGRMTPAWSGRLAIVRSPTNEPALATGPSVTGVRLIGLEVAPNGHVSGTSIAIGSLTEVDNARQPSDVVLDRLLVRGHPVNGQKRGLSLHGSHITVTRSYISDMKQQGQDTQAIWINNGWGPYTIVDNYLEASGENLMAGGDTPRIDQLVPSDLTITGNTFAKPLQWKAEPWTVKNLLELKSARRVVIYGNHFEGSWVSGQVGYGILLTPKDQYGLAPWTTVQDVLIASNVVHEVAEAISVLGDDHAHPAIRAERIVIRNNLLVVDQAAHGGSGRCLTVGRAPQQIEFSGNTCIANGPAAFYTYLGGAVHATYGAVFRANAFLHNQYGFSGEDATAGGTVALAPHYPDLVFVDNLIGGGPPSHYPGNTVVSVAEFQAQFVDYAGGDFRLTPDARVRFAAGDGTVPGADLTGVLVPESPPPPAGGARPPGAGATGPAPHDGGSRTAATRADSPGRVPAARGVVHPPDATRRAAAWREGAPFAAPAGTDRQRPSDARTRVQAMVAAPAPAHGPAVTPAPLPRMTGVPPARDVSAATAPMVSLTVSAPFDALPPHAVVTLAAGTTHLPDTPARVDMYLDGTRIGTRVSAPFELTWQVPASGTYRITAIATDDHGARVSSAPLDVTVR